MRMEHVLLVGSIVIASPAMSADSKSESENNAKPAREAHAKARSDTGAMAGDNVPTRPNRKGRVHRTFPPPTKHL